jgi:voltage-gated potassium channel
MDFTLTFVENLFRLLANGTPLFIGLGLVITALAVLTGWIEGWSLVDSVYFGFITATTVGYGDITPTNGFSKLISVLLSLIGLIVTGIINALAVEGPISPITSLIPEAPKSNAPAIQDTQDHVGRPRAPKARR